MHRAALFPTQAKQISRDNGVSYDQGSAQQDQWLKSLVQGCQTRPSQEPHLADQGVLQYWCSKTFDKANTESKTKKIKLTATGKVDDKENYDSIKDAMDDALCFGQNKHAKKKTPTKLSGAYESGENPSKEPSSHKQAFNDWATKACAEL